MASAARTNPDRVGGFQPDRGHSGWATYPQDGAGQIVVINRRARPGEDRDTVERARRVFLDALPQRLRFAQVAADLGLTPEALLKVYERSRINPREHLRTARLERLDEDLQAGRRATLAEALIRWGFPPASPGALTDYRKRYGRHPQETLDAALALRRQSI